MCKETFERLVVSGAVEKRAKEMIAAVLIEEMYYVLKNKENYNEQRYARRLSELNSDSSVDVDNTYNEDSYDEKDIENAIINNKTVVKGLKIGRNNTCPCGSGKKFKKCCGK